MKAFWDQRYSQEEYAYGETPNEYFKKSIGSLPPGKLLMPAEGEGRNAVYAATLGWDVTAFDLSDQGKRKAEALASKHHVQIDFHVGDCSELTFPKNSFDAIGLIYAHFPAAVKSQYHRRLVEYLRQDGTIIFEAYSKHHIQYQQNNPKVGGPGEIDMLFSIQEIKNDFFDFHFTYLSEVEIDVREGLYHDGKAMVIRFLGSKK
jgi:2-polyprenyl-3-methyl-5-hydroxy-6-metoxy-1,4-benzoquinol methylase